MDVGSALILIVLLVETQFASDARIRAKCDDGVNTLARIRPCLVGRKAFGEYFGMQVLVLLLPSAGLLWGATVGGALLVLLGEESPRTRFGGPMSGEAEENGRLFCTIQCREQVPSRVGDYLR